MRSNRYTLIPAFFLCLKLSFATTWVLPENGDIIGEIEYAYPQPGETLAEVGVRFDMGYDEMLSANPHVDSINPLSPHVRLLIPSQFILPDVPRHGLVINLAEYRLYFFPKDENVVITHPVGIGRKGWSTPTGRTTVVAKQVNPTWHPTANLLANAAKKGVQIPDAFPPGPGNPLGKHVLRLGWPTYLIHGTPTLDGVGERVSAGCIRMLPGDIDYLFELVDTGTPVHVINEPIKLGRLNDLLYIEVHPPLQEQKKMSLNKQAAYQIAQQKTRGSINQRTLTEAINRPTGIPKKITV